MFRRAMGMEEAIKRVLTTGEVPDVPFEIGTPVPVAFWDRIVFFVVRRKDGSFHHLTSSPDGTVVGGPLGDELPDRSELELYAKVGLDHAQAVLGFAPAGVETVEFAIAGTRAGVNPRNGAFILGVRDVELPHSDRLVAGQAEAPIEFDADEEFPDMEPGVILEDKVWRPEDG
jgi:hypothetical protein